MSTPTLGRSAQIHACCYQIPETKLFLLLSSLELSDTQVYEPAIRDLLGSKIAGFRLFSPNNLQAENVYLALWVVYRVSSRLVGPVLLSFRALSGRLESTVRRHKSNADSLLLALRARSPSVRWPWAFPYRRVLRGHCFL
jgi:hypothetical protein